MASRFAAPVLALIYAAVASVWIVSSQVLVDYFTSDPILTARLELAKGLLFVAFTSLLLYLALRSARYAHGPAAGPVRADPAPESLRGLAPLLVAIVLAVPLVGIGIYALHSKQEERETFGNLAAIAQLKVAQVEGWISERKGDGDTLARSPGFIARVARLLAGDKREQPLIVDRLAAMQKTFGYTSIVLLDAQSAPVVVLGAPHRLTDATRALIPSAVAAGTTQMGELLRDDAGGFHLDLVVPLRLPAAGGAQAMGAVVLHVDPERFLFPVVRSWPTASTSGEILLVRPEGEAVAFLNGSHLHNIAPLSQTLPLDASSLPAAIAARQMRSGTTRGVDYRGVPVFAAYRPVEGTHWHLVAKIDRSEALEPVRTLSYWVGFIALVAMLTISAAILLLVRQQRSTHQLALQLQSSRFLQHFYNLPFIGMAITSPATKIWDRFNDRLCDILGYAREELATKTWTEITHPDDLKKDVGEFERVMRRESEGYSMEKRFIRKDGSVVFAVIDVKCVRKPEGAVDFFIATIQDITEYKQAEARILRLNRLYATLTRCNEAIIHCRSEDELYTSICRTVVDSGAFLMAWVGIVDTASGMVRPVTHFGPGSDYLEGIQVSVDGASPYGNGPTGTAIREDQPFWCQDFRNDPATAPWHERATRYNWAASASLPLHREGIAIGALTIYADTAGAFDAESQGLLREMANDVSFALDSFAHDMERRQAVGQLRASEERLRQILDNSLDAILLMDPDGNILSANPAACGMIGCTENEMRQRGRTGVIDPADPRLALALEERQRTGRFRGELNVLRVDGSTFPCEISSSLFKDKDGNPRVSVSARDISERKRAEQALRESEQQFRGMVEQSIAGFYIIQDGRLSYVNQRLADILGYASHRELVGRDVLSFIPEPKHPTVSGYLSEVLTNQGRTISYTVPAIRKDGAIIDIGANAVFSPFHGRPAIMGLMQDISEKKRAEEQIKKYIVQIESAFMHTVEVAMNLSELRDPYTAGHERRVAEIAMAIGGELGFDAHRKEGLRVAGYLHDIGKITVPAEILAKPGHLSANEYALIKQHPQAGYEALKNVEFPWPVAQCALQHHERMDGSGYPQGLRGEEILIEARILAVADTIEAMSSHRPYRPGLGMDKALVEIERGSGTAYDAEAANAALRLFREKGFSIPE